MFIHSHKGARPPNLSRNVETILTTAGADDTDAERRLSRERTQRTQSGGASPKHSLSTNGLEERVWKRRCVGRQSCEPPLSSVVSPLLRRGERKKTVPVFFAFLAFFCGHSADSHVMENSLKENAAARL
jgi:hypothetical protein